MKQRDGRILPVKYEPEIAWRPKITLTKSEKANCEKGRLTLYRRSGVWNGIGTLLMVRELLPA
jgi:hypothetical protein